MSNLEKGETLPGKTLEELPCQEFSVKTKDNQSFSLKIFQAEKSIFFHVKEIGDIGDTLYKTEISFEDFYSLNRIFKMYNSTEELFTLLFKNYKESDIDIIKKDNKINLIFNIEFMGKKDKISFNLNPEQPKIENVVMNLCDKVKEIDNLNKTIKEQKEINNIFKNEYDTFKKNIEEKINNALKAEILKIKDENENKVKELENKLNQKDQYINQLKNEINNIKNNLSNFTNAYNFNSEEYNNYKKKIDSNIIKYDELSLIDEGIKTKFKKKVKKYELLFRANRDGFEAKKFHEMCDGKNYTVTFVITSFGRRFGGFTDQAWDQSGSYKSGSNGFIFSLDNKEIYYNQNSSYSIYCNSSYGPTFGNGHDFYLSNNCNINSSSSNNTNNAYNSYGKNYALAGTSGFYVKDYEVYKIEIE